MRLPKISIIVPSYNQGQFLQETILSIIDQQYPDLELFIIDGGSSDNSVEIIKKYEHNITWWVSEKDKGQSHAINKGLSKISGEIVSWVNSDDLLTQGTLHKVAEYFSQLPSDVGLIHGGSTLFDAKKEIKNDWGYINPSLERNLAGMAFPQPSAFFLKKYLHVVGGNLKEELHYGMDYDLFCRLACVCKFVSVKDIFSKYRLHDTSKSVSSGQEFIIDWHKVITNLFKNLHWQNELTEIIDTFFQGQELSDILYTYSFAPDKNLVAHADKRKILFYHYCYTLRSYYENGMIEDAKNMKKIICENFPADWWKSEKGVPEIMRRLVLPAPLISSLKYIRKKL